MTNAQSKQSFIDSEKGCELRKQLEMMVKSPDYNTHILSLNGDSEGSLFVQKHLNYMSSHKTMDHMQYLSNLKLMTRINK